MGQLCTLGQKKISENQEIKARKGLHHLLGAGIAEHRIGACYNQPPQRILASAEHIVHSRDGVAFFAKLIEEGVFIRPNGPFMEQRKLVVEGQGPGPHRLRPKRTPLGINCTGEACQARDDPCGVESVGLVFQRNTRVDSKFGSILSDHLPHLDNHLFLNAGLGFDNI